MKKIIATALIAALLTTSLAGCKNDNNNSSATNSENNSTTTESNNESNTESNNSDAPAAESKSTAERLNAVFSKFECFSPDGGMAMIVAGSDKEALNEVFPITPFEERGEDWKATHCVFEIFEDVEGMKESFGATDLNLEDCEDYVFASPMISAALKQIVIVKPKAGKEEAVKSAMTAFSEYAKTPNPIEYPAWEAERAGTHFGETSDGCFYVVVAKEGAEMGAAIENA